MYTQLILLTVVVSKNELNTNRIIVRYIFIILIYTHSLKIITYF